MELKQPHILVVDDDEHNLKFFREILRKKSYDVDAAASGEVALKKIEMNQYDLIVSDLNMYQVDGLDVLGAAKLKDPSTQVLILTGYGSVSTAVEAMKQGAYEYLSKPIDPEAFTIKVKNALQHRRMIRLVEEQQTKLNEYHKSLERDLKLAQQVHESLIPKGFENKHCVISVEYLPMMDIGGDFVDIFDDKNGHLYITTIDITGHGITAALMVNRLCSEIRKFVREAFPPNEILYQINRFFYDSFAQTGLFLTIMSVMIDYNHQQLFHAGSAHPAGLLYSFKLKSFKRLIPQNMIIGFDPLTVDQFTQQSYEINPGDRIIMFTDGLVEAENHEHESFGSSYFKDCLKQHMKKSVAVMTNSLIADILNFTSRELQDDVLLIVTEIKRE
jgi:phosphoserine phosphatase RsbU/P